MRNHNKDIAKEEISSLTQNAEELRVVYKEYSGREQFYYLNSNREEAIDGLSRVTNPIVIYQANEAVALNGSYIETGTYNGEVIYGCDESTIRNAAKKICRTAWFTLFYADEYRRGLHL